MQTNFSSELLSDSDMVLSQEAIQRCLQCGYCIDNCPTYQITGEEFDSPRGRVFLIRDMLESKEKPTPETVEFIDRCLSCHACMSSCPSFVNYKHLIDHSRAYIENNFQRPLLNRMLRWSLEKTLPYPDRFRMMMKLAQLSKPLASFTPKTFRNLVNLIPSKLPHPSPDDQPQIFPAFGERTRRVALLTGCAQKALNTNINEATIRILRRHGCEVVIAKDSGCCGALTFHMGKNKDTHAKAINNIRAWMREVNTGGLDAIVVNTSGCGTVVKDYGQILHDHELSKEAKIISSLTKDISEILLELELKYVTKTSLRIAYHASCSLQFGQRLRFGPKKLLKAAGFSVTEPQNQHVCCGAAGTYNLLQPKLSAQLRNDKAESLERNKPDVIAAGNIGCMMQIGSATKLPVLHTVELLDWATGGPTPESLQEST